MSLLYEFLPGFQARYPGIATQVIVEDSTVLKLKLLEHAYDFGIMVRPEQDEGLLVTPLPPVRPCIVVPPALASEPFERAARHGAPLVVESLHDKPLAIFRRAEGGGMFRQVMDYLKGRGIAPKIVFTSPSAETIVNLLEQGLQALGFVPRSEIPRRMEESFLLCGLPPDFPFLQSCAAKVEKRYLSRAATIAWDELQEFVERKRQGEEEGEEKYK